MSMSWSPIIEHEITDKHLRYPIQKLTVAAGPVFLAIFGRDFVQKYPFGVWKIAPACRQQLFCPVLKLVGPQNWGFAGQTVPDTPEGPLHTPAPHSPTRSENIFAPVHTCKNLGGWPDLRPGVLQGVKGPAGPICHLCWTSAPLRSACRAPQHTRPFLSGR